MGGVSAPVTGTPESSLPCGATRRSPQCATEVMTITRTQPRGHRGLRPPASRTVGIVSVVSRPPSLWQPRLGQRVPFLHTAETAAETQGGPRLAGGGVGSTWQDWHLNPGFLLPRCSALYLVSSGQYVGMGVHAPIHVTEAGDSIHEKGQLISVVEAI